MNAPSEFLDYGPDAVLMAGLTGRNWRLAVMSSAAVMKR